MNFPDLFINYADTYYNCINLKMLFYGTYIQIVLSI
jgi:hypothetical protein